MVHTVHGTERETRDRVGNGCCETVDSNLHSGHFSRITFISIPGRTTPVGHRWLKHFGLTPVPRFSARFPIFFNVASRARNSFGLASAKTFLISAACLRKIGAINFLPFVVNDTTRTRRSSELSTRRERPFPIPANSEPGLGSSCPWRNYFDISYNGCPAAYIYINRIDINNSGKRGTRHME